MEGNQKGYSSTLGWRQQALFASLKGKKGWEQPNQGRREGRPDLGGKWLTVGSPTGSHPGKDYPNHIILPLLPHLVIWLRSDPS